MAKNRPGPYQPPQGDNPSSIDAPQGAQEPQNEGAEQQTGQPQAEQPQDGQAASASPPAAPPADQRPEVAPLPGAVVAAAVAAAREGPKTVADAFAGEDTVTLVFPTKVIVTLPDHRRIEFTAGPNEVPVSLAGVNPDRSDMHWWLRNNGVTHYTKG